MSGFDLTGFVVTVEPSQFMVIEYAYDYRGSVRSWQQRVRGDFSISLVGETVTVPVSVRAIEWRGKTFLGVTASGEPRVITGGDVHVL